MSPQCLCRIFLSRAQKRRAVLATPGSMRPDCASNATRTVLDALSKLAAPDLLNTSDLEASLLPSERCFLRSAGLHDAAGQLPSCNAADNNSRVISCWHMDWGDCSKRPLQTGRESPSRKYGGERPWLPYVSRYASLAAGAPESSHFAVAAHLAGLPAKSLLQGDGRLNGLRTLFVGDSLANQLQSAAACELGRAPELETARARSERCCNSHRNARL